MGGVLSLCCTQDLFKDAPDVWYASQSALEADYAFGAALGEGMFAKVRVVTRRRDGAAFAAKVFKKRAELSDGNELSRAPRADALLREIDVLRRVAAPGSACVRLAGVVETPGELLLLTELCGGGDLMHHVEGQRKFTAGDAAAYFSDACAAIARCHAVSVAHRDVKPENMLVAFDGRRRARVRLSDFGSACVFAPGDRYAADAGSPFWSSPEAWALDYDHRGDVYSVGVVLLVLVDGMLGGDEVRALHGAGLAGLVDYRARFYRDRPPGLSAAPGPLRDLLEGLLAPEAARLSAAAALGSPWLAAAAAVALANPARGVLAQRRAERAARAALVAVADGAARRRVRAELRDAPGLPPGCAALGELAAAADRAREPRLAAALRALHATPDLVLVHRPFALEALATLGPGDRAASALTRAPAARRAAAPAPRRAASSQDLARLAGGAGDPGPAAPPAVGRRNAPGADGGRGAISMDGTYSGLVGIFADDGGDLSDASLHGLAAFEDRAGDADRAT